VPNGLILKAADGEVWHPTPQGKGDLALMHIATAKCFKKDSLIINRCRLYLQLFSIYDLILHDHAVIHPQLKKCERVTSRISTKYWVDFRRPPKRCIKTWQQFLTEHIEPIITQMEISWRMDTEPIYNTNFFISNTTNTLYQKINPGYLKYLPKRNIARNRPTQYHITTQLISLTQREIQQLMPIETNHTSKSITILGPTNINSHKQTSIPSSYPSKLHEFYHALSKSMKRLCGKIQPPLVEELQMLQYS
jgi:hypothetical protein